MSWQHLHQPCVAGKVYISLSGLRPSNLLNLRESPGEATWRVETARGWKFYSGWGVKKLAWQLAPVTPSNLLGPGADVQGQRGVFLSGLRVLELGVEPPSSPSPPCSAGARPVPHHSPRAAGSVCHTPSRPLSPCRLHRRPESSASAPGSAACRAPPPPGGAAQPGPAMLLAQLPGPTRDYPRPASPPPSAEVLTARAARAPPPYGTADRKRFRPRKPEDFGDGGAFPEIQMAQYPLDMGKPDAQKSGKTLAVTVGNDGAINYDAVLKQGLNKGKTIASTHGALIPKVDHLVDGVRGRGRP